MASKKKTTTTKSAKGKTPKRKSTAKKTTKSKKAFSLRGFIFKWAFVLGLWGAIILGGVVLWYGKDLPDITAGATFERKNAITILDRNGETIMRYGEMKGENITAADVPPYLIDAVLATEDRRFYSHFGIDPLGLARAMITNLRAGRLVQGGSTITQQLAKNLFLSRERSLERKIKEALLALWLEKELTKDEILSAYLNRVYLGAGTYGVDAASKLYFGKDVRDINLQEAAILAGLLKAPSRYSPSRNPNLAKQRANVVLAAMVDAGYITEDQIGNIKNLPPRPQSKPSKGRAVRYFTDWAIDDLNTLIGTPQSDITIYTTLDKDIQNRAESVITRTLLEIGEAQNVSQGAALVLGLDGRVLAMVGGRDYIQSQFNRAVQAKRQPGSSFKPFVYLTALEQGWSPDDKILDARIRPDEFNGYQPKNYADEYFGELSLEEALGRSLNTATVRLMDKVGRSNVIKTARKLGIRSELAPDLSLALGSSSVSMLEMTLAYTSFANGGYAAYPYGITKITDNEGNILYQRDENRLNTRRVVERSDLADLNYMLASIVLNGTGRAAQIGPDNKPYVFGKTGTSQDNRDAWFVGFTDGLVASVWLGNDDNAPMNGVTGGNYPASIWSQIIGPSYNSYAAENSEKVIFNTGSFNTLLRNLFRGAPEPSAPRDNWNFNQ